MQLSPGYGLDAFNALNAASQTGFGAFIPAYLASHAWNQTEIGVILTIQTVTSIILQVPAGAMVDVSQRRRTLLAAAVGVLAVAALLLALLPNRLPVAMAVILQAAAAAIIYPSVAALSLQIAGRFAFAERLGRNTSFAAVGSGIGAAAMGMLASIVAPRAVFLLATVLAILALVSLRVTVAPKRRVEEVREPEEVKAKHPLSLLRERRVLVFALAIVLFNLGSNALLPVAAADVTRRLGPHVSGMLIAAWIVAPQIVVALSSPLVGRLAERLGRRPVLIVGFLCVPVRALLFAFVTNPVALTFVQALDGITGAALGIMIPLMASDLMRGTNRSSTCLAVFGLAGAFGAALSTTLAGLAAANLGTPAAFSMMAGSAALAAAVVFFFQVETRPQAAHG
jgi:MFS family permease